MKSPKFSFASYFFLLLVAGLMATFSTLLVINAKEDWEFRRLFCEENSIHHKEFRLISGMISQKSLPDPESGFVVYNIEYQTKRNHWNLYQVSVGSFFLEVNQKTEVLVSYESGIANHNFDNKNRTFRKTQKSSEAQLRWIGSKIGDTVTVVYDPTQSNVDSDQIQASAVYAGSPSDLCQEETSNAFTALGGAFIFALISLGISFFLGKGMLRIYRMNRAKR